MNAKLARQYGTLKLYRKLRDDLLNELTDEDLSYTPEGENPPLGVLCRRLGEVQKAYVESFKTFKIEFAYQTEDERLEKNVEQIRAWYQQLDEELEEALEALTDDEVDNKTVFRSEEFKLPPVIHLDVFREALIIFYGKVIVYLRTMGKTPPTKWDQWIG